MTLTVCQIDLELQYFGNAYLLENHYITKYALINKTLFVVQVNNAYIANMVKKKTTRQEREKASI